MSKLILLLLLLAVFTLSTEAYDYRYHVKCKYHAQQTIKKVCAPQYNNWCHEAMDSISKDICGDGLTNEQVKERCCPQMI